MSDPAIEFRDVSLIYRLPARKVQSLKEWVVRRLTTRMAWRQLRALSHVSFSLERGNALGVIGANGAGKSTMLRVIGGILVPTHGEAVIRGRLAPIIELGTGFELELSGRENVYFNGALLGRSRDEMETRFDDIVDFSGLDAFIDAPIRTYSMGMIARLAFAIATTVDAQILLLDEVLSVGDESFRQKCQERIKSFRDNGVTILLVSHDLPAIEAMCDHVLWLDQGEVRDLGETKKVVKDYKRAVTAAGPVPVREQAIDGGIAPQIVPGEAGSGGASEG